MKKKKRNAPQKGQSIKVEPITDLEHIKLIKRMLENEPRNLALFIVGINTALRASDLVRIKTEQVKNMQAGDAIELKEKKTKKNKRWLSPCSNLITYIYLTFFLPRKFFENITQMLSEFLENFFLSIFRYPRYMTDTIPLRVG